MNSQLQRISKKHRRKRCPHCGKIMGSILWTTPIVEEWYFDGDGYNACNFKPSLASDPDSKVLCGECENVVGTGRDFGFGKEYKYCEIPLG